MYNNEPVAPSAPTHIEAAERLTLARKAAQQELDYVFGDAQRILAVLEQVGVKSTATWSEITSTLDLVWIALGVDFADGVSDEDAGRWPQSMEIARRAWTEAQRIGG